MGDPVGGRELIGGVGLDEQSVSGNGPEDRGMRGLPWMKGVSRDAEVGSQSEQLGHQFHRTPIAVQQETPGKPRSSPEAFHQGSPSLQAMQGDRKAAFRSQCQLLVEHLELNFEGCRA
jgi:hypothetical protein